jgi:DNA-binding GntR family transcriptional regulator
MQITSDISAGVPASPMVVPPTRRQAVVERLRDQIVSGELAPGTLLREIALANSLGVSPTPVREAFGELASEGLVEIEAHRLKRVAPIDFKAMLDLFRVQGELWRMGYVWGMPRIDAAALAELDGAVAAYRRAVEADDALGVIRASHAFHTVFITASDNGELRRATLDRRSLIARFILIHGRATLSLNGLRHHEAILRSFRRADRADVLARIDQISQRLVALAQGGAGDGAPITPNA